MKLLSKFLLGCLVGVVAGCGSTPSTVQGPPIDNEGPAPTTSNRMTRAEFEARLKDGRLTRISPPRLDDGPLPMGWQEGMPPVVTYAPMPAVQPGADLQKIMIRPPECATRNYELPPELTFADVLIVY